MKNYNYITKNRLGIYCFQYSYQIPYTLVTGDKKRALFRKSLRTRDKSVAILKARYLWILMKEIHKKYFSSADNYALAMKLVAQYEFFINN